MSGRGDQDRTYRAAEVVGRSLLRALKVDLQVTGAEHVPTQGPVILASTHVSYLDMLPIALAAGSRGRRPRFMARHDVWQPVLRHAMDAMRHIPVDRQAPAGAYLTARALLRAGECVAVFPEGGISYSYTVRGLTRGTAALARETGAVVVPVALWGVQRIYSVGRPAGGVLGGKEPGPDLTRGRRVDVALGEPMRVGAADDLDAWTDALGHRLTTMLEGLQTLPQHRPRPDEDATWHPVHLGGSAPSREESAVWDNCPRHVVRPTWGPAPWPPPASREIRRHELPAQEPEQHLDPDPSGGAPPA